MATSAFGKAFRAARAAGDKTFEFDGKKYTTELAKPKPKTATRSELGPEMGERMSRAESQDAVSRLGGTPRSNYSNEGRNAGSARLNSAENKDELSDMMKSGGKVKGYAKGGVTRADGCITKGHTKGRVR